MTTPAPALTVSLIGLASLGEWHFASSKTMKRICSSCYLWVNKLKLRGVTWLGCDCLSRFRSEGQSSCSMRFKWVTCFQKSSTLFLAAVFFFQHHSCPLFLLNGPLTFPSLSPWIPFGIQASFVPAYTNLWLAKNHAWSNWLWEEPQDITGIKHSS